MNREQLIEKAIQNQLTPNEQEQVERLLSTDADFAKELKFQQDLKTAISTQEDTDFKQTLSSFEPTASKSQKSFKKFLLAASIVIGLGLISILLTNGSTSNNLFSENFAPYPNVEQPVVRGTTNDDIKTLAFIAYEQEDYKIAIEHFETLNRTQPQAYTSFYLANSYLAIGQTGKAIPHLQDLTKGTSDFQEQALWYLALSKLQLDEDEVAKKLLQQIVNSNTHNALKAKEILNQLK